MPSMSFTNYCRRTWRTRNRPSASSLSIAPPNLKARQKYVSSAALRWRCGGSRGFPTRALPCTPRQARPDAKGAGRACVRCDVRFSSECRSAAVLDQRFVARRKPSIVHETGAEEASIVHSNSDLVDLRADCEPSQAGRSAPVPKFQQRAGNKSRHPSVFLACGQFGRGRRTNR
jgi:hypothetical protein